MITAMWSLLREIPARAWLALVVWFTLLITLGITAGWAWAFAGLSVLYLAAFIGLQASQAILRAANESYRQAAHLTEEIKTMAWRAGIDLEKPE